MFLQRCLVQIWLLVAASAWTGILRSPEKDSVVSKNANVSEEFQKNNNNFIRDDGLKLNHIWTSALQQDCAISLVRSKQAAWTNEKAPRKEGRQPVCISGPSHRSGGCKSHLSLVRSKQAARTNEKAPRWQSAYISGPSSTWVTFKSINRKEDQRIRSDKNWKNQDVNIGILVTLNESSLGLSHTWSLKKATIGWQKRQKQL